MTRRRIEHSTAITRHLDGKILRIPCEFIRCLNLESCHGTLEHTIETMRLTRRGYRYILIAISHIRNRIVWENHFRNRLDFNPRLADRLRSIGCHNDKMVCTLGNIHFNLTEIVHSIILPNHILRLHGSTIRNQRHLQFGKQAAVCQCLIARAVASRPNIRDGMLKEIEYNLLVFYL